MKSFCGFCLLFLLAFAVASAEPETRGLWVVRHSITSRSSIDRMISLAELGNFNTLFVQVVGKGEAYYKSSILPPPQSLANNDTDLFAYLLGRAHARGLEVHAWVNCFYVWSGAKPPPSDKHVIHRHPEWVIADRAGRSLLGYSLREFRKVQVEGVFLSPGHPGVREFILSVVREIAGRYDVDGIHLDYIRYPLGDFGYDRESRRRFFYTYRADPLELINPSPKFERLHSAREIRRLGEVWPKWREERVTETVRGVSHRLKLIRPDVKLSAAVYPDPDPARRKRFQDWPRWLEDDLVDFVVLMNYSTSTSEMVRLFRTVRAGSYKGQIYNGIGAWRISRESTIEKIQQSRLAGARGLVLFSYDGLSGDPANFQALRLGPFRQRVEATAVPGKGRASGSRGQ